MDYECDTCYEGMVGSDVFSLRSTPICPSPASDNQADDMRLMGGSVQNKSLDFCLKDGRMAYILCMEGKAAIKGSHGEETLDRHEAAHVVAANNMTISGPAHCMMIEMADAK
mmetsp:Transcript_44746/g.85558  ORF Transcript_44746/g.85558 Transcript_44746/m.85558 type:complete len:112 (-) Transcript_44746:156-491(-)